MDNNMKIIFFISIILTYLVGCKDTKNDKPLYKDSIIPDTSVNDIKLSDTTAVVAGYNDLKYNIIKSEDTLPYVIFTNENKTEMLKLYLFYGT